MADGCSAVGFFGDGGRPSRGPALYFRAAVCRVLRQPTSSPRGELSFDSSGSFGVIMEAFLRRKSPVSTRRLIVFCVLKRQVLVPSWSDCQVQGVWWHESGSNSASSAANRASLHCCETSCFEGRGDHVHRCCTCASPDKSGPASSTTADRHWYCNVGVLLVSPQNERVTSTPRDRQSDSCQKTILFRSKGRTSCSNARVVIGEHSGLRG